MQVSIEEEEYVSPEAFEVRGDPELLPTTCDQWMPCARFIPHSIPEDVFEKLLMQVLMTCPENHGGRRDQYF